MWNHRGTARDSCWNGQAYRCEGSIIHCVCWGHGRQRGALKEHQADGYMGRGGGGNAASFPETRECAYQTGSESQAVRCGLPCPGPRWTSVRNPTSESTYWAVGTATTADSRETDHHVPAQPGGSVFSPSTAAPALDTIWYTYGRRRLVLNPRDAIATSPCRFESLIAVASRKETHMPSEHQGNLRLCRP